MTLQMLCMVWLTVTPDSLLKDNAVPPMLKKEFGRVRQLQWIRNLQDLYRDFWTHTRSVGQTRPDQYGLVSAIAEFESHLSHSVRRRLWEPVQWILLLEEQESHRHLRRFNELEPTEVYLPWTVLHWE